MTNNYKKISAFIAENGLKKDFSLAGYGLMYYMRPDGNAALEVSPHFGYARHTVHARGGRPEACDTRDLLKAGILSRSDILRLSVNGAYDTPGKITGWKEIAEYVMHAE